MHGTHEVKIDCSLCVKRENNMKKQITYFEKYLTESHTDERQWILRLESPDDTQQEVTVPAADLAPVVCRDDFHSTVRKAMIAESPDSIAQEIVQGRISHMAHINTHAESSHLWQWVYDDACLWKAILQSCITNAVDSSPLILTNNIKHNCLPHMYQQMFREFTGDGSKLTGPVRQTLLNKIRDVQKLVDTLEENCKFEEAAQYTKNLKQLAALCENGKRILPADSNAKLELFYPIFRTERNSKSVWPQWIQC